MKKKPIRIIICDDHDMIRRSLDTLFSSYTGYKITASCKSGTEAIHKTLKTKADILLLDLNMPSPDGFEVAAILREAKTATRIIAISVSNSPEFCKKMLELGARGYITKTSEPEEFLEGVKQVMMGEIFLCEEIKSAMS